MTNSLIQILAIDEYDNTREVIKQYFLPAGQVETKLKELFDKMYQQIPSGKGRIMNKTGRGYTWHYSGGDAELTIYNEYYGGESKVFEYEVLSKFENIGTGLFEPMKTIWLKNK
jgi:hypothetical protein